MESPETETQDERIHRTAHNLTVLVKDQKVRVLESKQLCLKAMEVLLVYPDFFCTDFYEQLERAKQICLDELKNESSEDTDQAGEQPDEQDEGRVSSKAEECIEFNKQEIEQVIGAYIPAFQRKVLEAVLAELPEKERAYQEEEARDAASNELIDLLSERPYTEQTEIYKGLTEQVRNGEVVAVA